MAKKDDILCNFLKHELITKKYKVPKSKLPNTVNEAKDSEFPIIKSIALIIEGLDGKSPVTDLVLRSQVLQFLNEAEL